jgi:hypothetical protein
MGGWTTSTIVVFISHYFDEKQEQDAVKFLAPLMSFMLLYTLTIIMAQNGFRTKKPLWLWPFIVVSVSLLRRPTMLFMEFNLCILVTISGLENTFRWSKINDFVVRAGDGSKA